MSPDTDISVTALSIAVVALVIAVGQITQQYFATAEGFRRCQRPVMGDWARKTRSKFRASELRYQTIFYTPHITFVDPLDLFSEDTTTNNKMHLIGCDGLLEYDKSLSQKLRFWFRADKPGETVSTSFRASWLTLLEHVSTYQKEVSERLESFLPQRLHSDGCAKDLECGAPESHNVAGRVKSCQDWCNLIQDVRSHAPSSREDWRTLIQNVEPTALSLPAAKVIEYTWDFMPPDVVRPFATVALGDLLILGHRLGLDWTIVKPTQGSLQAQDDLGNSISSSETKGLGLLATFTQNSHLKRPKSQTTQNAADPMIPTLNADKLAFGIITSEPSFGFNDVVLQSGEDCLNFWKSLGDEDEKNSKALKDCFHHGLVLSTGIGQVLPIISTCIAVEGSNTNRVRRPNMWSAEGVIMYVEGYVVFKDRLTELRDSMKSSGERYMALKWIFGPGKAERNVGDSEEDSEDGDSQWQKIECSFSKLEQRGLSGFVWQDTVNADPLLLSSALVPVHKACTSKLQSWSEDFKTSMIEALEHSKDGMRQHSDWNNESNPLYELVRAHLIRAPQVRVKMAPQRDDPNTRINMYGIETVGKNWPMARQWCCMMNIMLDEVDDLAQDVLNALMDPRDQNRLAAATDAANNTTEKDKLIDGIVGAWYVLMFRALVFNRSIKLDEPKHAQGKPYNPLPSQWYDSQIPINIG